MTTRELGAILRQRLGDRAFIALSKALGSRIRFPSPRTARSIVFVATLRRGAARGQDAGRLAAELTWLGYRRSSITQALRRLGLRPANPKRQAAGRLVQTRRHAGRV